MVIKSFLVVVFISFLQFPVSAQQWKKALDSARLYVKEKNNDQAIFYFLRTKSLLKDSINTAVYIHLCNELSTFYFSLGRRDDAEPVLLEGRSLALKNYGSQNADYGTFSDLLGQKYLSTDPKKAEGYFIEGMEARKAVFGDQSAEYAISCNNLGVVYNVSGEWDKALLLHSTAKEIREKLTPFDSLALAQSCNNLGDLYRVTGQFDLAEPNCLKAKNIREAFYKKNALVYGRTYAISSINLANLYRDMGQYKKAEMLYQAGKDVREVVLTKKNPDYAASCDILATLYHLMGEDRKAEQLFLEAAGLRESIQPEKQSLPFAESIDNLANLYRDMGLYKEAEEKVLQAKSIWEKILLQKEPALAINYNNVALLYAAMKKFSLAEEYFLKARNVWKQIANVKHPAIADNSNNLATLYWNSKQTIKANDFFIESFETKYEQLEKFFKFTSEKEKQTYIQNIAGSGDQYFSFAWKSLPRKKAGQVYTMSLLNRSIILKAGQDLRTALYQSKDNELIKKHTEWVDVKKKLAQVYSNKLFLKENLVQELESKADLLEKEITRAIPSAQKNRPEWKEIQKHLLPGEATVEFVAFHYYNGSRWTDSTIYIALVLRKDLVEPVMVPLFERRELENILKASGNINTNDNVASIYASRGGEIINATSGNATSIYNLIWKPVQSHLSGIKTLYFAPAGLLHRIAFSALPVNSQQLLSDKFKLIQLNTTASIASKENDRIIPLERIVAYGNVKYTTSPGEVQLKQAVKFAGNNIPVIDENTRGNSWDSLPGTKREIGNIASLGAVKKFQVNSLEDINATEESFKLLDGKESPAVIHIATHGFYSGNNNTSSSLNEKYNPFKQSTDPLLRSGLLFASANNTWSGNPVEGSEDGILTAYEVANLFLPNTKLVVLSACETALGDIQGSEGVYGLQRAFNMAGVKNLVMSLWKVPDQETADFMSQFYKDLFSGKTIDAAFYSTQHIMKNKYRNEPYKWAAWIFVK
jgi:CHAT domain-containing protein